MSERLFGDVVKYSVGRVCPQWSVDINDGLLYANDPTTLGEGASQMTFSLIHLKNDDGLLTGESLLACQGSIAPCVDDEWGYSFRDVVDKIPFIQPWEKDPLREMMTSIQYAEEVDIADEVGIYSLGEEGQLGFEPEGELRVRQSLVINATVYRDCVFSLDASDLYGVSTGDEEPKENETCCALIWHPSDLLLAESLKEADQYFADFDHSLAQHLEIIKIWQSTNPPALARTWSFILENLAKDDYIWHHTSAARIARNIVHDEGLFWRLVEDAKILCLSEQSKISFRAIAIAQLLDDYPDRSPELIVELLDKAIEHLEPQAFDDIESILSFVLNSEIGGCLGALQYAEQVLERILSRITEAKKRTSFKRKGEKFLDSYRT